MLELPIFWDRRPGGLPEWITPGYAMLGYLPLLLRKRFPLPVLLVVVLHNLLAWVLVYGYVPTLNVWLALYAAAFHCGRRAATCGLLAVFLPIALTVLDETRRAVPGDRAETLVISALLLTMFNVAVFGVGRWAAWTVRQRQRAAADAVSTERNRIARDLHDIVAHAVSLMLLQAAGASRVMHKDPGRAVVALGHVEQLGQQAIVELRRMLNLLAGDADQAGAQQLPGLRNLEDLLKHTESDTFRVVLKVAGNPVPLEPGVDLSSYRIVQEALTNASRYADRRFPVVLEICWHPTELDIRIRNRIAGGRRNSAHRLATGRGLIGMEERATAVGGRLHTGTGPDGNFVVAASFPLASPSSTSGGSQE
ncbi:histidine kinase [Streptomyces sp. NPDC050315]|uniref:sensor histidine kinase n=1 Tax=Streptomyces sp. NPDC050315 TaxID=3155039 RepID=UPI003439CD06